jgi:hypothetical protein
MLAAQMIFIARDDDSSRLVRLVSKLGLVFRVSFKGLRVVAIKFTQDKKRSLDQCLRVNGVKSRGHRS